MLIVEIGAIVRCTDSSGRMPAHVAAASAHASILALLLNYGTEWDDNKDQSRKDKGTPLFSKDLNKHTLLHHAARSGDVASVALIVDRWLDAQPPNTKGTPILDFNDRWHRTPVHW